MAGAAPLGNQNAAKSRIVEQEIRKLCIQEDYVRLRKALNEQLDKAAGGDLPALQFIADRTDGKPAQAIVGENGPLEIIIRDLNKEDGNG